MKTCGYTGTKGQDSHCSALARCFLGRSSFGAITGFALEFGAHPGVTEPPTDHELKVLRELHPQQLYPA